MLFLAEFSCISSLLIAIIRCDTCAGLPCLERLESYGRDILVWVSYSAFSISNTNTNMMHGISHSLYIILQLISFRWFIDYYVSLDLPKYRSIFNLLCLRPNQYIYPQMEGGLMRDIFTHNITTPEHWYMLMLPIIYTAPTAMLLIPMTE